MNFITFINRTFSQDTQYLCQIRKKKLLMTHGKTIKRKIFFFSANIFTILTTRIY